MKGTERGGQARKPGMPSPTLTHTAPNETSSVADDITTAARTRGADEGHEAGEEHGGAADGGVQHLEEAHEHREGAGAAHHVADQEELRW